MMKDWFSQTDQLTSVIAGARLGGMLTLLNSTPATE